MATTVMFDTGKKDYTAEVSSLIEQIETTVNVTGIDDSITALLVMEKKCRVNNDFTNLTLISKYMLKLCKETLNWSKLNAVLALINKRSSQIKSVITSAVAEAMDYINSTPSEAIKMDLIKSLKDICDGKIYVESESAKLHFMLSKMYEEKGNLDSACEIVQDVHVETYGSLSKKEKADFILEQIRLNLLKKDYIRALIHSRKMNLKTIEEIGFEEVKVKFYRMMIEYHMVEKNTWEIAQAYYKIANTPILAGSDSGSADGAVEMKEDNTNSVYKSQVRTALEGCVIFLLMSKFDNHQSDMLHRLHKQLSASATAAESCFKEIVPDMHAVYHYSLTLFTTREIIPSPFENQAILESHASLTYPNSESVSAQETATFLRKLFHDRVVQHNLRVVAGYYKRIRSQRLCQLLGLAHAELERHLAEISCEGDLYLKIDRPAGIIDFVQKKMPEQVLSAWTGDITQMLHLVEATCHLINRENMVYKA